MKRYFRGWYVAAWLFAILCSCTIPPQEYGVLGQEAVGDCSVTLATSPSSPQAAGTSVTMTATGSCISGTPEYKFYTRAPGGSWVIAQDWNSNNTYTWDTTSVTSGSHQFQVWTRRSGETIAYEGASAVLLFDITGGSSECTAVSVATTPTNPQDTGTTVTFTMTPTCGGTAEYKIYRQDPSGSWNIERDWNSSNTYAWDTTNSTPGDHQIQIWARVQGSTATYEAVSPSLTYTLKAGNPLCDAVNVSASPELQQNTGATVTFIMAPTCTGGGTAEFKIYRRDPSGKWNVERDWDSSGLYEWNTSNQTVGNHLIQVWVRAQGSQATYEGVSPSLTYTLTTSTQQCSAVTASTSPSSPSLLGTPVTLTATPTCSGGATPTYKFYIRSPAGQWNIAQDWSTSDTYNWDTNGLTTGSYVIQVWIRAQGSSDAYEGVSPSIPYELKQEGVISTLAGNGSSGYVEGTGSSARFFQPFALATDAAGNIYIADAFNHRIRKVTPAGETSLIAGTGVKGFADGAVTTAQFNTPYGIAVSADGKNIYIVDSLNYRIRKIDVDAGTVSTVAGNGTPAVVNGQGTSAQFLFPFAIELDGAGNMYISDKTAHIIRKIDTNANVTTFAGSGVEGFLDGNATTARFNDPWGIAIDSNNNVYIGDYGNHRIRKITQSGVVTTLAGSGVAGYLDGTGTNAQFQYPHGIDIDTSGNIYVADTVNHRVRKITPAGVVTTLAGNGTLGFVNGNALTAQFHFPIDIAVNNPSDVIILDYFNHSVRKLSPF